MEENKKPVKEIGVWTVLRWTSVILAELIFVFSGTVTIKAGQFFIGILFFVLAVLVFVPRKIFRISKALKIIILIIIYFTLLVISGFSAPVLEQQYEYYNLNQSFDLTFGDNVFSVFIDSVDAETQMVIDEQEVSSSGFFFAVNGSITNLGKIPLNFDFQSELKDSQDNLYTLIAFAGDLDAIQPNLARKFSAIFEIPRETKELKFIIKDETEVDKMVDLKY
jgi:hypothetical protein